MNENHRNTATDEIIGIAFRRSLLVVALVAALVAIGFLVSQTLQEDDAFVDTMPTAPVAVMDTVAPPDVRFTDITAESGIDFMHVNGASGDKLLPETMGGGVAFLDYDSDGDADLLFINSDSWAPAPDASRPTMRLYANDGAGRFVDVTADAGLSVSLYGMGTAIADYDNDGDTDIFVTATGANRLFRNDGGAFTDVTADSGVAGADDAWSTSAAFVDVDNDGDLDLFVANYVRWSRELDFEVNFQLTGIGRAYGPPNAYPGTDNYLYLNDGNGRFTDVSAASGIRVGNPATGEPMGKALGVAPVDVDRDGWIDLLVANDTVQNFLFRNLGDGSFEESGSLLGIAFDRDGKATGAMGVDVGHFRNDDDLGFAVGNFANEMTSLYVTNNAQPPLTDEAIVEGIGPASRRALTFGVFFFDYDLDGRLDFLQANGHLEEDINKVQSSQQFRQPAQLFWNCGRDCRASFVVLPKGSSGDLDKPLVGRGAAYADIDADGDLDVVLTQNGGAPLLLRNDQATGHNWLRVRLVGSRDNRDATGAWVELTSGGVVQRRQVMPSRSYLSQVEATLTFGLGTNTSIDAIEVMWPDGTRQSVDEVGINSTLTIEQQ